MSLNIYVLDVSPVVAAQMLDDVRLVDAVANATVVLNDAWLLRRRAQGDKFAVYGQIKHPRHPITKFAAASAAYCDWITEYASEALDESAWRGIDNTPTLVRLELRQRLSRLRGELRAWPAVDVTRKVVVSAHVLEFADFPQRLDGGGDAALVAGDPATAYRRWYVESKVPGGALAWKGAEVVWTRRCPSWLIEMGICVDSLPWSGLGSEPTHSQWVASRIGAPVKVSTQSSCADNNRPASSSVS